MSRRGVQRQVAAILESNGLRCSREAEGFVLRFSSAVLHVGFAEIGRQVIIELRSTVLSDVPVTDGRAATVLHKLNELNARSHFGKWVLYDEEQLVVLEYDLLGDHLQEPEFMTALATLARLADQHDDLLQQSLGGRRAVE